MNFLWANSNIVLRLEVALKFSTKDVSHIDFICMCLFYRPEVYF